MAKGSDPGIYVAASGGWTAAGSGLLLATLLTSPAFAQLPPPVPRVVVPTGAVVDDPYRVFGDDAPTFAPLAVVGALGGALGLSGSGALVTTYSDNVARQADGAPLPSRFVSKDDWIFRPTVGLSADRPIGNARLFADVSLGRTIYARNTTLNSNRLGISGGVDVTLGNSCSAQARGGYSTRDTQLGTFEEVVPSTQVRTTFGASGACRTISGLSASIGYNRGRVENDSDEPNSDRSFADVNSQSVNGSIGYAVGTRGQVGVSGSWGQNEYPNQFLFTGDINQNEIVSLSLFGAYRVGNSLRANASIGQTRLTSNTPGAQGFQGLTWNLGLGYAGPRIGGNISLGRNVNGSSGGSANYSVRRYFNLTATYRLNDSISTSAGYARENSDFRGISQVPETEAFKSNVDDRVFIGADYRLNRILSFGLDINHQRRSSSPTNFSYKVNNIVLSARVRF